MAWCPPPWRRPSATPLRFHVLRRGSTQLHPDRLELREIVEHRAPIFAPEARLLVASVRARRVEAVVRVDPHRAGTDARRERVRLSDVARPHACRQTELRRLGD